MPVIKRMPYIISNDRPEIKLHSNSAFCPFVYELIPAHGCEFECAYCNVYSMNENKAFYPVTVFKDYPDLVSETIDKHRLENGNESPFYYLSPKTDVFQKSLIETNITHKILEVLVKKKVPFILVTKGKLPDEDILQLLIKSREKCRVLVSYGMKNEEHAKILEPYAASLEERFELACKCSENLIPAMGVIEPILPFRDLTFVKEIIDKFVDLKINLFAFDFARISKICLNELIEKLPELNELNEVYCDEEANIQNFQTGPYHRKNVLLYGPSNKYRIEKFTFLKEYAESKGAIVSICNSYKLKSINENSYKKGFLCFGIYDPVRSKQCLDSENCM